MDETSRASDNLVSRGSGRPEPGGDTSGDFRAAAARFVASIGEWARRNPETAEMLAWVAQQWVGPPPPGEEDLSGGARLLRRLLPANWHELPQAMIPRARATMLDAGVCLAWVPRAEVVRKFVGVSEAARRDALLLEHESLILEDLRAVAAELTDSKLGRLRSVTTEAIAAFEAGFPSASQALSAAAISGVLAQYFGEPKFADARRAIEAMPADRTDLRVYRRSAIQRVLLVAIAQAHGEPKPDGFNRHLTAHGVEEAQYTRANALAALLLLVGLARELQEVFASGDQGFPLLLRAAR